MSKKKGAKKPKPTKEEVLRRLRLPIGGDVPFEPPNNWYPTEPLPKGPKKGYVDKKGREWTKGPTRTSGQDWEWDVQLPDGGHLNIDWDGTVTH